MCLSCVHGSGALHWKVHRIFACPSILAPSSRSESVLHMRPAITMPRTVRVLAFPLRSVCKGLKIPSHASHMSQRASLIFYRSWLRQEPTLQSALQEGSERSQGGSCHTCLEDFLHCCSDKAHNGWPLPRRHILHSLHKQTSCSDSASHKLSA